MENLSQLQSSAEVEALIRSLEDESQTKFITFSVDRHYNDKDWQPLPMNRVHWQWAGGSGMPAIKFTGIPFMFVGSKRLVCHQGKDLAVAQKRKYFEQKLEDQNFGGLKCRRASKKVGCPAAVSISKLAVFPKFKMDDNTERAKKKASKMLRITLERDPVVWETLYAVVHSSEHAGHANGMNETKETTMENDGKESAEEAKQSFPRTQQLCRFFSQGRRCNFGNKCKFLHVRELKADKTLNQSDATISDSQGQHEEHKLPVSHNPRIAQAAARRPCRYFLSGYCSMEDRCRFWHPQEILDNVPVAGNHNKAAQSFPPVSRPSGPQEVKLCNVTEDVAKQLRETEIRQLKKRFPKDQLIIQERSDGKVTYYRVTVEATDPDWPFDLKEIDVMVSFPDNYPLEIFTLDIPLDQDLPPLMAKHVQQASIEWLQAKHATNQLLGKLELLFRPFLRWLDRSLERLFTEGARQLKKDIDLEKAGLQFIPYQELKVTASENSDDAVGDGDACNKNETVEGIWSDREETSGQEECPDCDEGQQEEEASHLVENIKISDPRRGTEVKLLGLRLGEYTATVVAQQITVCLQCHRCKVTADLTLSGRTTCAAQCEKCNASISAAFRPCMLHHYSDVLGYLDLHNATAADLILQDCDLIVGCLSCSQDVPVQHVFYGQTKEFNCEQCHSKLSILVESTRFQFIPPRPSNKSGSSSVNYKTIRDPAVQKGKPLPEKGTCKHYKQSHRWLRFPCCGRAYPCDGCHDENQDHPMELATRMICGFCAKEQPYNNGKPCVSCGSMMTRGTRTSHWEGGLGCRNKAKMSRNDRQKYSNSNKTVSRKAAGDKK